MAFNLSEFKSRVDAFGGPARTSLFTVELYGTPNNPYVRENELLFFCNNVTMPGINVETIDTRRNAIDLPQSIPTAISKEPLQCSFMLDSDHRILSFFHTWSQKVVNYSTQGGNFSSVDDQLPYELGYKDEYSCNMSIKYYSVQGDRTRFYETVLGGVYPTTVQSVNLTWAENDSIATLPIGFSYDRIQYSAEIPGVPNERFSRGNGLIDLINNIGRFGQLIDQQLIPEGVQDAINTYTRVTNTFNTLRNIF